MFSFYIKLMLLSFLLISSIAFSNNVLISQGDIEVTNDDLDGFSYTIPKDDRSGFFNSPVRIDQTLKTMLTMKHIVNYAESENMLDLDLINNEVSIYILDNNELIENYNLNDIEFLKLKKFLFNKLAYKFMHVYIKDSVKEEDVLALAKEQYMLDKENYYLNDELRTLQYITIKFTKDTRVQNKDLTHELLVQLKEVGFKKLEEKYKDDSNIIFTTGIDDFYFNKKYEKFSEFVFKPNSIGVIDGILEGEKTYIISEVLKITEKGYKPFEEVKESIVNNLKKQKTQLKFGNLVTQLTQDEINVVEEAILSLKTRYLPKK